MTLNTILDRLGLPTNGRHSPRGKNDKFRRQRFKHRRRRALLENLEDRRVLATYMVTSLADSGSGSLRAALQSANTTGVNTIVFDDALRNYRQVTRTGPPQLTCQHSRAGIFECYH